jgi:long-chain acyl-CoA synthetase
VIGYSFRFNYKEIAVAKPKLILDYVYDHEAKLADRVYLTQPVGGGQVVDYTWKQTLDQARRMAAHIKAQGLTRCARVAILSKNCAHFFMAELAIWMAGCTTVAIFPTETAETIGYVLEHSGASMLFVGKLDTWDSKNRAFQRHCPALPSPWHPRPVTSNGTTSPVALHPDRSRDTCRQPTLPSCSTHPALPAHPKGVMHSFERITQVQRKYCQGHQVAHRGY